jgi:hypothetical protein
MVIKWYALCWVCQLIPLVVFDLLVPVFCLHYSLCSHEQLFCRSFQFCDWYGNNGETLIDGEFSGKTIVSPSRNFSTPTWYSYRTILFHWLSCLFYTLVAMSKKTQFGVGSEKDIFSLFDVWPFRRYRQFYSMWDARHSHTLGTQAPTPPFLTRGILRNPQTV